MPTIEAAILRTLIYADLFNYPMTSSEIWRYLIYHRPTTLEQIEHVLKTSQRLPQKLIEAGGYYALCNREDVIHKRRQREELTRTALPDALRYGRWLAHIPFVRMVALTGSLAMRNPRHANDDYDYMLVTQPGRVWLARAFAIVLVRFARLRGRELCPNYVIDSDHLFQQQHDIYVAHEVVQMLPLYGRHLYCKMLHVNQWTQDYLPNACALDAQPDEPHRIKQILERLLSGKVGDVLERWEYHRKRRKFTAPSHQHAHNAAQIDEAHVKGHFEDHGYPIVQRYQQRLREYDLQDAALDLAGD